MKIIRQRSGWVEMFVTDEEWRPEYSRYFSSGACNGLVVGAPMQRTGMDISFLLDVQGVRSLRVLRGVSDLTPVMYCASLERLWISEFYTQQLDLSQLVRLCEAEIPWKAAVRSLPRLVSVEELTVTRWKGTSFSVLAAKPALQRLRLEVARSAVTSAEGADMFPRLQELRLYSGRLRDSRLLADAHQLRNVALLSTKTDSVAFVAALPCLERLELENSGDIETLAPLAEHPALREVLITGSTRISDGDLAPIADNPRLTLIAMERGHPHYSHRPAEIRRGI
ncbi:hypothetical protein ACWCRF_17025 [Streptomyces sp. NPDC002405]